MDVGVNFDLMPVRTWHTTLILRMAGKITRQSNLRIIPPFQTIIVIKT